MTEFVGCVVKIGNQFRPEICFIGEGTTTICGPLFNSMEEAMSDLEEVVQKLSVAIKKEGFNLFNLMEPQSETIH